MTKVAAVIDSITSRKKRKKIRFTRGLALLAGCLLVPQTLFFSYWHCKGVNISSPAYKFATIDRQLKRDWKVFTR
jgi:hypothetical protein